MEGLAESARYPDSLTGLKIAKNPVKIDLRPISEKSLTGFSGWPLESDGVTIRRMLKA